MCKLKTVWVSVCVKKIFCICLSLCLSTILCLSNIQIDRYRYIDTMFIYFVCPSAFYFLYCGCKRQYNLKVCNLVLPLNLYCLSIYPCLSLRPSNKCRHLQSEEGECPETHLYLIISFLKQMSNLVGDVPLREIKN